MVHARGRAEWLFDRSVADYLEIQSNLGLEMRQKTNIKSQSRDESSIESIAAETRIKELQSHFMMQLAAFERLVRPHMRVI